MNKYPAPPTSVTILAVFVLFITSWNGIRAYTVIKNWRVLSEFGANPAYILVTGLIWLAAGLWLLYSIGTRRHHTRRAGMAIAGLYYLWYWCDWLFIQSAPAPNALFAAAVSSLVLIIFVIILETKAAKVYFEKEW